MPVPDFTPFNGLLPSEGDPVTFPSRAQALFEWFTGTGAPQLAGLSSGVSSALAEMLVAYDQTNSANVDAQAARSATEAAKTVAQSAQAGAAASAYNAQAVARFFEAFDDGAGSGLKAQPVRYEGETAEVGTADIGSHLEATASGYDRPGNPVLNAGTYRGSYVWQRWVKSSRLSLGALKDATAAETAARIAALATEAAARTAALAAEALAREQRIAEVQGGIAAISTGERRRGSWNPATPFPGGAGVAAGDWWEVSVAGTRDGLTFAVGDGVQALQAEPSTTVAAGHWDIKRLSAIVPRIYTTSNVLLASFEASRGEGALWQTFDNLPLKEAAADAVDAHFVTAGGVKLYGVPVNGVMNARQMGAACDGVTDDTDALNRFFAYCVANGLCARVDGPVLITGPILFRTNSGRGAPEDAGLPESGRLEFVGRGSILVGASNTRGLILHGRGIRTSDIRVIYSVFQDPTNPESIGVAFRDLSHSKLGFLEVFGAAKGFAQDPALAKNWFFDNEIDALRAFRFSVVGVSIWPTNEGNTPSVIHSISVLAPFASGGEPLSITRSGEDGTKVTQLQPGLAVAVQLRGTKGLVVDNMVIESTAASDALLDIRNCDGFEIGTLHFEGVELTARYAALVALQESFGRIGAITGYDIATGGISLATDTCIIRGQGDAYVDCNVISLTGKHYPGASVSIVRGAQGNIARINKWVDKVVPSGTGGNYVLGAPHLPVTDYTPGGVHIPLISYFDGIEVLPCVAAQGVGSTVVDAAGGEVVLTFNEFRDSCAMYDPATGLVIIPRSGVYRVSAKVKAEDGFTATVVIRRNGTDILNKWTHDAEGDPEQDTLNQSHGPDMLLNAGDTLKLYLRSGRARIDITCNFSVVWSA
ncbi:hypothetical protein [Pseudooceanicola spongiae]|uniref:Pectate lyase superfamily protein domain-containing protein n=1 Tax=Pseudooceanicola spongiae TaxID=2613965 RepID=A0A7L9WJH7_9RHOB|nr:hypothetical protein [Pseudooceanicola spongiae]QOL80535.1 hypothetical protein F3W81_06755 [Pseudooceanicola spongiae]